MLSLDRGELRRQSRHDCLGERPALARVLREADTDLVGGEGDLGRAEAREGARTQQSIAVARDRPHCPSLRRRSDRGRAPDKRPALLSRVRCPRQLWELEAVDAEAGRLRENPVKGWNPFEVAGCDHREGSPEDDDHPLLLSGDHACRPADFHAPADRTQHDAVVFVVNGDRKLVWFVRLAGFDEEPEHDVVVSRADACPS